MQNTARGNSQCVQFRSQLGNHQTAGCFVTTCWNLVLASGQPANNREALEELCRIYWRPVFAFVRRRGYSAADAQDLTQDFFLALLSRDFLRRAEPSRGRFRSFLMVALENFLSDARTHARAQKRGGQVSFISWENCQTDDSESQVGDAEAWPPSKTFDVRWAQALLAQVMTSLRAAHARSSTRAESFEALRPFLTVDPDASTYAKIGDQLGLPSGTVRVAVSRLRQQYRTLLREEVARTVESSADIDDELRYLGELLRKGATVL